MGELIEVGEYHYLFVYGKMQTKYSTPSLEIKFSIFSTACRRFVEEELLSPKVFITTTVHNLIQPTDKEKRFHVYRHLIWVVDYRESTQFLVYVEKAIKE